MQQEEEVAVELGCRDGGVGREERQETREETWVSDGTFFFMHSSLSMGVCVCCAHSCL